MGERHPKEIQEVRFKAFEGSSKNKQVVDRGCVIYIGSMERPNSLHSGNYKLVHCSEVGLWKATKERKPSDFVNAFEGSVPLEPFTMVALESTAKGTGNFFHTMWMGAVRGENAYTPVFVAWWEIDMYTKPFSSHQEMKMFVESMSEKELLAQIKQVQKKMQAAAAELNFELAAQLRDQMMDLKKVLQKLYDES